MLQELQHISDSSLLELLLNSIINVEAFNRFWALETLAGHWNGYTGNHNGFWVGQGEDGRLLFFPSTFDGAFIRHLNDVPLLQTGAIADILDPKGAAARRPQWPQAAPHA